MSSWTFHPEIGLSNIKAKLPEKPSTIKTAGRSYPVNQWFGTMKASAQPGGFSEALLRRQFEKEFRKSRAARVLPRRLCYMFFCSFVFAGFLVGGLGFGHLGKSAGLVGGEIAVVIGLLVWAVLWN